MKTCLIFFLSFAILLLSEMESTTFTFENNCRYTVWPGTLTIAGKPQLSSTGFELPSGESSSLDVQPPWTGRFWGRTHCSTDSAGKFICGSGDCDSGQVACNGSGPSPPTTLVEPALAENFSQDDYDISLIDGFNLPISMTPIGGSGDCRETSCRGNVNEVCPSELSVKGSDGSVVGCKSACSVFYRPEYCCIGKFSTPATCPPTEYSKIFKSECPQAYSYVFDDPSNTFTCSGGPNYKITFCP